jgi:diguanylate cyclase (GGDEF)-like protein
MTNFFKKIKEIINFDKKLKEENEEQTTIFRSCIALIIALGFLILSIINIIQKSYLMFYFTTSSSFVIQIGSYLSISLKKSKIVDIITVIVCVIAFSFFAIVGGNNGFAILWIILVPFVSMIMLDMKIGFFLNVYFLVFLTLIFWTPINSFLVYNYDVQFCLRFPLLYLTSFILSTYEYIQLKRNRMRTYEYEKTLAKQKDYDLMTNTFNRSKYEEMLEIFESSKTIGVIFFDVNSLKYNNDKYGHDVGDLIIKRLADSLIFAIPSNGNIFRFGGDEFVVVITDCKKQDCFDFIKIWKKNLRDLNEKDSKNYICEVAYGVSFGDENFNYKNIVEEADRNMYLKKQLMKTRKK